MGARVLHGRPHATPRLEAAAVPVLGIVTRRKQRRGEELHARRSGTEAALATKVAVEAAAALRRPGARLLRPYKPGETCNREVGVDSLGGVVALGRTLDAHPFAGPTIIGLLRALNKTTAKHPLMFATANLAGRSARSSLRVLQDRQAAMRETRVCSRS